MWGPGSGGRVCNLGGPGVTRVRVRSRVRRWGPGSGRRIGRWKGSGSDTCPGPKSGPELGSGVRQPDPQVGGSGSDTCPGPKLGPELGYHTSRNKCASIFRTRLIRYRFSQSGVTVMTRIRMSCKNKKKTIEVLGICNQDIKYDSCHLP